MKLVQCYVLNCFSEKKYELHVSIYHSDPKKHTKCTLFPSTMNERFVEQQQGKWSSMPGNSKQQHTEPNLTYSNIYKATTTAVLFL